MPTPERNWGAIDLTHDDQYQQLGVREKKAVDIIIEAFDNHSKDKPVTKGLKINTAELPFNIRNFSVVLINLGVEVEIDFSKPYSSQEVFLFFRPMHHTPVKITIHQVELDQRLVFREIEQIWKARFQSNEDQNYFSV